MPNQSWIETPVVAVGDGTAVANSTTETTIFPDVTRPANSMANGRVLRLRAFGKLSTTGTPTIRFGLRWGTATGGVLLWQTELITTSTGSATVAWEVEIYLVTRSNGSTGTLLAFGPATVNLTATTAERRLTTVSGFDAPAVGTCDLTVDTLLTLTAIWSAASPSNTLTGMHYTIEDMN